MNKHTKTFFIGTVLACVHLFGMNSYTLGKLCHIGLADNPAIKALSFQAQAKKYGYKQSLDRYKPHVTLGLDTGYNQYKDVLITHQSSSFARGMFEYSVNAVEPIYQPFFLNSIKNADLHMMLSKLKLENEKALLVAKIANLSIELIRQRQVMAIAKSNLELFKKLFAITKEKYKLRLADKSNLFQAKAQFKQAQSNLLATRQKYLYTLSDLKLLVNNNHISSRYFDKDFNIDSAKQRFSHNLYERLHKRIFSNTQVRIYEEYVKIAKNAIKKQRVRRYPVVTLDMKYASTQPNAVEGRRDVAQALVGVSLPLYQGGEVSDAVQEAKLNLNAANEYLQSARLKNLIAFEQNWNQIISGISNISASKYAKDANYFYVKTALESYKDGVKGLTYVQLAEVNYYNAKIKYIDAESVMLKSIINLYYYAGISTSGKIGLFAKRYIATKGDLDEF